MRGLQTDILLEKNANPQIAVLNTCYLWTFLSLRFVRDNPFLGKLGYPDRCVPPSAIILVQSSVNLVNTQIFLVHSSDIAWEQLPIGLRDLKHPLPSRSERNNLSQVTCDTMRVRPLCCLSCSTQNGNICSKDCGNFGHCIPPVSQAYSFCFFLH